MITQIWWLFTILLIGNGHCASEKTVALVLARGGSKGIPLKNLAQIGDQTLLSRTLSTIKLATVGHNFEIWVSTDHSLIAKEAIQLSVNVFNRSAEYAGDTSSSLAAVKEFLKHHPTVHRVILVQCTSPFLKVEYLKQAIQKFSTTECVFSVRRSHDLRWEDKGNGSIVALNFDPLRRPRRQDWNGEFIENGMFYLASRYLIMERNAFQSNNCKIIEVPTEDSMQIDTPNDLILAELLLNNRQQKSNKNSL